MLKPEELVKGKVYVFQDVPRWFWIFEFESANDKSIFDNGHVCIDPEYDPDYGRCTETGLCSIYDTEQDASTLREATDSEIKLLRKRDEYRRTN